MSVTIKDIAERAGVSFSTVSKALRNSPLVQEKTKHKIMRIAEEMGYRPNIAARRLVSQKSGAIGVVWPSVNRAAPSMLITKIVEELEEHSYTVFLSINRSQTAIEAFHRFQVDAILVFYEREPSSVQLSPDKASIPILHYGIAGSSPYPTIDVQRKNAIRLAARHLTELGHREIAYIGTPSFRDPLQEEKAAAFIEAAKQYGFQQRVTPIAGMELHDGYLAAKNLLQMEARPTAIISGSYDLARGILRAAGELNISVPDQLSVVSYDHMPQMGALDTPITSVGVEVNKIARKVTETLLQLTEKEAIPHSMTMEPELIVRASSAAPSS